MFEDKGYTIYIQRIQEDTQKFSYFPEKMSKLSNC